MICQIAIYQRPFLMVAMALPTAMLLAGCTTSNQSASPTVGEIRPATSFAQAVQRTLRSSQAARSYDRGLSALRRGDDDALLAVANEMRASGAEREAQRLVLAAIERDKRPATLSAAERAVMMASALDSQAQRFEGAARDALRERSAAEYRNAQRSMPKFNSDDPMLLNALGYFLAERGESAEDFREAERLTRRALQLHDKPLASPKQPASPPVSADAAGTQRELENWARDAGKAANELSHANIRDSLAWALFRQKRFAEAAREQEQAVRDAQRSSRQIGQPMSAELHFHLGEIYRALKRQADARRQYETALRLNPDDPSRAALEALNQAAPSSKSR